jgi:HSP20 family protein
MHDYRLLLSSEVRELSDEIARLFEDLDRSHPQARRAPPGETTPPLDVIETDVAIEIAMDAPGMSSDEIRVLIKQGIVVVVGEKAPPDPAERSEASFHLVERGFGRFARAVRIAGACEAGRTRATLYNGELRIVVPKIPERRGRDILIPVEDGGA